DEQVHEPEFARLREHELHVESVGVDDEEGLAVAAEDALPEPRAKVDARARDERPEQRKREPLPRVVVPDVATVIPAEEREEPEREVCAEQTKVRVDAAERLIGAGEE